MYRTIVATVWIALLTSCAGTSAGRINSAGKIDNPSFDCTKNVAEWPDHARGKAGRLFCKDAELAAYDRALEQLGRGFSSKDQYDAEWKSHLVGRDIMAVYMCEDRECLQEEMSEWLDSVLRHDEDQVARRFQNSRNNGRLRVLDTGGDWYAFILEIGGPGNYDWKTGLFRLKDGKGVFRHRDSACTLTFSPEATVWQITQQGVCGFDRKQSLFAGRYSAVDVRPVEKT